MLRSKGDSYENGKAIRGRGRFNLHCKPACFSRRGRRNQKIYAVGVDDLKQFKKYEKIWKEIFNLR